MDREYNTDSQPKPRLLYLRDNFNLKSGCDLLSSENDLPLGSNNPFDESLSRCTNSQRFNSGHFPDPTSTEKEHACRIALETHLNLRFLQSEEENQESIKYLKEIFLNIPCFDEFSSKTQLEDSDKTRQMILKCEVVRGSILSSKGLGKCDPYCKLAILAKRHINAKVIQKGNISDWVVEGIVEEESIKQSTSKVSTMEPEWQEVFELYLDNPQEEYLVVEAWNSDKQDRKGAVKGKKGFGKLLDDLKSDGFMGRAFYLLKHLHIGGGEKVLELHSHSGRHNRGSVTVHLNIVEKEELLSDAEKLEQFRTFLKVVLAHESKKDGDQGIKKWNGQLTETAERLLTQYMKFWSLSKLRAATVRFSLLMDYHKTSILSMSALEKAITDSSEFDSELEEDERPSWVLNLIQNVQILHSYISGIMKKHLEIFNFKSTNDIQELRAHLLTLRAICSSKIFQNEPGNVREETSFNKETVSAIQIAVSTWFLAISTNVLGPKGNEAIGFKALCSHCLNQCQRIIENVQPVFKEVGIDYFSHFFIGLDQVLCTEAESAISSCLSTSDFQLGYDIYRLVHDLKMFGKFVDRKYLSNHDGSDLNITRYDQWFKGFVSEWIKLAQQKAMKRLSDAVVSDTTVENTDGFYFSSSSVDARYVLQQMTNFWKELDWPNREQSIGYFIATIQVINDLAICYADLIFKKVTTDEFVFCDRNTHVVITDQLCIALNNVSLVKSVLAEIGDNLDLDSYYKWLDEEVESGPQLLSRKAKELWTRVLESADQDIQHKKDQITKLVLKQIIPTVNSLLSHALEIDHTVPSEAAFGPLLDYMASNVGKLGQALLTPTFLSILEDLWDDCIEMLKRIYRDSIQDSTSNVAILRRLNELLTALKGFFIADGSGLSIEQIETQQYLVLTIEMKLSTMTTQQLIRVVLQDMIRQQEEAPPHHGVIRFSHLYDCKRNILKVNVLSAKGIPASENAGKKNMLFVEVLLLPTDLFHKAAEKQYKTEMKKQSKESFFNSTFDIPSEAYKLKEEGSLILLAMFDAETRGNNGFKGLCVVECKLTPQGYELKMEHQNLFHLRQTKAHEEIERRSSESLAKNFLKLLKRFIPNDEKQSTLQLISLQSGIDHISRLRTLGRSLQIRQQKPMTSH